MKKKVLILFAAASMMMLPKVFAEPKVPQIIVDERELIFDDQQPVIVEETSRTLIPLRFVLESAGAKVTWDGDERTVTVDAGDNRNRAVLKIDSDEMQVYFYPSVASVVSETVKLDQAPVIMNERTMIPVRAVLEAIGAKVDWDEKNYVINVTSRAYTRYLRDMGLEGYEVEYPLSNGDTSFDTKKERENAEKYNPDTDLPTIWLSSDAETAAPEEEFSIYLNVKNVDKIGKDPLLTAFTLTLIYDHEKVGLLGYELLKDDQVYKPVIDASNSSFTPDSAKIAVVADLGVDETSPTKDGSVIKLNFMSLTNEEAEIKISSRSNSKYGMDTNFSFKSEGKNISLDDVNELNISATPIVINKVK